MMNLNIDRTTEAIMDGMDCFYPDTFRQHVRRVLQHIFFRLATKPGSRPEDAYVAVFLRIGDWMAIRDNLVLDADAQSSGKAVAQLERFSIENEVMLERAAQKDAEEYCHVNTSATVHCAAVIDEALKSYGWVQ